MSDTLLDLRSVPCPMNFVKAKLCLEKLETGDNLKLLVDLGEPVESVSNSLSAEGHIIKYCLEQDGHCEILIQKG